MGCNLSTQPPDDASGCEAFPHRWFVPTLWIELWMTGNVERLEARSIGPGVGKEGSHT